MKKETLIEILKDAADGEGGNGCFDFDAERNAALLVASEGSILPIEGVRKVELKTSHVVVSAARVDVFFLVYDRILGLKLQRCKSGGPGFVP